MFQIMSIMVIPMYTEYTLFSSVCFKQTANY